MEGLLIPSHGQIAATSSVEARLNQARRSILAQAGLASGLLTEAQLQEALQSLDVSPADWSPQPNTRHPACDTPLEGEPVAAPFDPDDRFGRPLAELSPHSIDHPLAERLLSLGYLNRWQAEQLSRGRTKFTLGPYRILDAIGFGGMGYVFKCEHSLLGRIEAIKVLPRSKMDELSIASFCREIRAQAQLDHPNLVRLSFADIEGDTYYLVTEYVPGSDLRRLVRHHGPLAPCQAALVISQAAEALAYAHQRGLVHRDVKPGNLLVTPEGRTKLTDLGLASFSSEARTDDTVDEASATHIVGTPDFLAPETVTSPGEVRCVSDIYSLGCTLYYAVTGKVPFPGGKTRDKLRRHVEEPPLTPLRFAPRLDPDLVELIAEMMCKNPAERLASANQVVQRLAPWTQRASEADWHDLGQYALEPSDDSLTVAELADTSPAITRANLASADTDDTPARIAAPDSGTLSPPPRITETSTAESESPAAPLEHTARRDRAARVEPLALADRRPSGAARERAAAEPPASVLEEPAEIGFFPLVLIFTALATAVLAAVAVVATQ